MVRYNNYFFNFFLFNKMMIVILLLIMLSLHMFEKYNFNSNFQIELSNYVTYLHNLIKKNTYLHSDLLTHQIKFKKVCSEITNKQKKTNNWF